MKNPFGTLPVFLLMVPFFLLPNDSFSQKKSKNPAAEGFDAAGSDAKAVAIADDVMAAQGGRKAWDNTKFIRWNFFGSRKLTWNKWTGDVRVEGLKDGSVALVNINTGKGRYFKNGTEYTQPDSLAKYLPRAKSAWINDSYWLVMPFKLKDSGLTLKYVGEEKTEAGADADKLQLTFKNVGDTPQNKYYVWVDKTSHLVSQWAHYRKADDEKPNFVLPWKDYQKAGNVMLSGDRGARKITEIEVLDSLPEATFTQL